MTDVPRQEEPSEPAALMPVVYDELRRLAGHFFQAQRREHTLQPTALVNEAYLRLSSASKLEVEGRTHFFRIAAQAMRQVLCDHARGQHAAKRGGDRIRVTLAADGPSTPASDVELVDLSDAIERLSRLNQRHSDVVILRFFGGLTVQEVATELGVSQRTVEQDWTMARAWLLSELSSA